MSIINEDIEAGETTDLESLINFYEDKEITKDDIINLLKIALNDELLATYNYMASYNRSKTEGKADFDPEFEAHEAEEYDHAHQIINRLRELGVEPLDVAWNDIKVKNSAGAGWKQEFETDSSKIIVNRYNEEVAAVDFYSFILKILHKTRENDDFDSTTQMLIKKIKADEEEHAKDLFDLIEEHGIEVKKDLEIDPEDAKNEDDAEKDEDAED